MSDSTILTELPRDTLFWIFTFFKGEEILRISSTCKKFKELAESEDLWKYHCVNYEGITQISPNTEPKKQTWKYTWFSSRNRLIFGYGSNNENQLSWGFNAGSSERPVLTRLPPPYNKNTSIQKFACEGTSTWLLASDGNLFCQQKKHFKQLGLYQHMDQLKAYGRIVALDCGDTHAALLMSSDHETHHKVLYIENWSASPKEKKLPLYSEGAGNETEDERTPNPVILRCGRDYTAVIDDRGSLYITGKLNSQKLPSFKRSSEIYEKVLQIGCGMHHLIARGETSLWGIGASGQGQLLSTKQTVSSFEVLCPVLDFQDGGNVIHVDAGYHHSCCITDAGHFYIWGQNQNGALGGFSQSSSEKPVRKLDHVPHKPIDAVCGGYHTHVIFDNGEVWGTGYNGVGQLACGHQSTTSKFEKTLVGHKILEIQASGFHTLARIDVAAPPNMSETKAYLLDQTGNYTTADLNPKLFQKEKSDKSDSSENTDEEEWNSD